MAKMSCIRCGSALTEGARFCTKCGATTIAAETADFNALKTRHLSEEQTDQKAPSHSAITEEFPSIQITAQTPASTYETEEFPRTRITAHADERPTTEPPEMAATQSQTESLAANRSSGGRKGLLLAAAVGAVILGAGSFFFINSRRASDTQTAMTPTDEAKPAASAQPSTGPSNEAPGQSSPVAANDQTQPQPQRPDGGVKSPLNKNGEADKKPTQQADTKPTPAPPEKGAADGTGAAIFNYNQGVTYMNAGRYQDALRQFEYVKKLDPGNKNVYYLIGQTYHKMGQLEQALEAYRLCTSGNYASVALNNAKAIEKRLGKTN